MRYITPANAFLALAAAAFLSGCAGPQPVAYSGLSSASVLTPNTQGPANMPYRYGAPVNWQNYTKAILDPVTVYEGPDAQFGTISKADQEELASYMQTQFYKKLSKRFDMIGTADASTLRIHLTLTGATKSVPLLSTALHADMAGNLYNGVQAVRGGPGLMTGSVMYSVEIYDAESNKLLEAYVVKQYPNSENIFATLGTLAAAKAGINKGAASLARQLD